MNRAALTTWVQALRSGSYEQGRGRLASQDGKFCCLGVLCEVAVEDGLAITKMLSAGNTIRYDRAADYPPLSVIAWLDVDGLLDPVIPYFEGTGGNLLTLDYLNDHGFTFDQIADLIEWRWLSTPEVSHVEDPEATA